MTAVTSFGDDVIIAGSKAPRVGSGREPDRRHPVQKRPAGEKLRDRDRAGKRRQAASHFSDTLGVCRKRAARKRLRILF